MRWMRSLSFAAVLVWLLVPAAAEAQRPDWGNWRFDLGVNGGYGYFTAMLDDEHLGEDTEDVKFEAGWLLGGQATAWFSPRVGLRANLGYTERPLTLGNYDVLDDDESTDIAEDVNIWHGTGDLMFRLGGAEGARFLPYLALGAGATWFRPAATTFADAEGEGIAFGVSTPTGGNAYLLERETKLTGLAALGTDIRLSRGLALRLEVGDRFFDAPLALLNQAALTGALSRAEDDDVGRVTHEVYGTLGLQFLMGIEAPPAVAIVEPAPAPPPVVEAPREESITVCVVDPMHGAGLRTVSAYYLPATRDTMVVVNGQRVDLHTTTGNVVVASNADWFVRGQPLAIGTGNTRMEFVSFGGSRLIEANDLVYLGTVRGLPVYGDRRELGAAAAQFEQIRGTRGNDLEVILGERSELRTGLEDVSMLYVPLQPTGCVFQPVQRVQEVRKGK